MPIAVLSATVSAGLRRVGGEGRGTVTRERQRAGTAGKGQTEGRRQEQSKGTRGVQTEGTEWGRVEQARGCHADCFAPCSVKFREGSVLKEGRGTVPEETQRVREPRGSGTGRGRKSARTRERGASREENGRGEGKGKDCHANCYAEYCATCRVE